MLPYMGKPKDDAEDKKPHPAALKPGGRTVRPTPGLDGPSRGGNYAGGGTVKTRRGYGKARGA